MEELAECIVAAAFGANSFCSSFETLRQSFPFPHTPSHHPLASFSQL